jgi:hypothetical protein
MTRPSIVRADTIDLQDHNAPSAAKHAPAQPNPSLAPHQAETLRDIAQETAVEEARSPHLSWNNGNSNGDIHQYAEDLTTGVSKSLNGGAMQNKEEEDALAIAQNGGVSSSDEGDLDNDGDGDLDDDMMDKISSSPSIEDGAFYLDTHNTASYLLPNLSSHSDSESELSGLASLPNSYAPKPSYPNVASLRFPNRALPHPGSDGHLCREHTEMDSTTDTSDTDSECTLHPTTATAHIYHDLERI